MDRKLISLIMDDKEFHQIIYNIYKSPILEVFTEEELRVLWFIKFPEDKEEDFEDFLDEIKGEIRCDYFDEEELVKARSEKIFKLIKDKYKLEINESHKQDFILMIENIINNMVKENILKIKKIFQKIEKLVASGQNRDKYQDYSYNFFDRYYDDKYRDISELFYTEIDYLWNKEIRSFKWDNNSLENNLENIRWFDYFANNYNPFILDHEL